MGRLQGKIAIVTGASRGIGAEIAKVFATEGAKVVCVARTLHEGDHPMEGSLDKTVQEIRGAGGEATPVVANIAAPEECEKMVKAAREAFGPIDVLVNNAALAYPLPIKEYPLNRWMRSWAVNVHAPFYLSQLVLEDMISRRSGAIVNISSGAARGPGRGPFRGDPPKVSTATYGAQKAALERLTQGMAQELYQYGISVTALSPSQMVPTPGMVLHRMATGPNDPRGEHPSVMAKAALLLASEPPDKVTGRVTYSQQILKEFGWIKDAKGTGVDPDRPGSGYSLM